ncbi:hypothetical protein MAIT1_03174 [Magnetofaba australis IT-1]|uniref:Uncharacterized protein n=1 Tax=Magnetofaba australis IT-1 TaxID=1434232 RepID=A0A1Y2K5R4_9PROT|nr:hypothetical protein MAIT1_03174 [Magnetofaba australis IT-1]
MDARHASGGDAAKRVIVHILLNVFIRCRSLNVFRPGGRRIRLRHGVRLNGGDFAIVQDAGCAAGGRRATRRTENDLLGGFLTDAVGEHGEPPEHRCADHDPNHHQANQHPLRGKLFLTHAATLRISAANPKHCAVKVQSLRHPLSCPASPPPGERFVLGNSLVRQQVQNSRFI